MLPSLRWGRVAPTEMPDAFQANRRRSIRPIAAFIATAFVASYAFAFAAMAAGVDGRWVQAAAVSGPTIAALVALRMEGRSIHDFFRTRLLVDVPNWRLLAIVPLLIALSFPALILSGGTPGSFAETWSAPSTFGTLAFNILVIALLEEIGWRGYLTPKLLQRMTPFNVSLVVGVVWALWHGPKLLSVPVLGVVAIALSFVMTFLVATRKAGLFGSIMLHGSFNGAVMPFENFMRFETALATFKIMAGGMVLLAIALVAMRKSWFFGKQAGQEAARPASE